MPGRADRPVPAGRRRARPGRGGQAGRLGGLAHLAASLRAEADDPGERIRRPARGAREPVPHHRAGAVAWSGAAVLTPPAARPPMLPWRHADRAATHLDPPEEPR